MAKENSKDWFNRLSAVAGSTFAYLGLFSSGQTFLVRCIATVIGTAFVLAWLFAETEWLGKAIKFRWFRSKLSKDQAIRLSVQLDEINSHMSTSYTLSPFWVWHSYSNKYHPLIKMNYEYHSAIHTWLNDIKEKINNPGVKNLILLDSLSKAIFEASKLARFSENEIESLIRRESLTPQDKKQIEKEWDAAKNHFNQWINNWSSLFKEINKSRGVTCTHYFQPLGIIS